MTWEKKLEQVGIAAATLATGVPVGLPKVHHDSELPAETERLIFSATTGEEEPAGSQMYKMALQVEFRTTDRNAQRTDAIFAAIEAAFADPSLPAQITALFPAGLVLNQEESQNARDNAPNTLKRSRTYSFNAGQI